MKNRKLPRIGMSLITLSSLTLASQLFAAYSQPSNYSSLPRKDFTNKSGDDSARLNDLIKSHSNGAVIRIKSSGSSYEMVNVVLKDNIHLEIESGVTIKQSSNGANVFRLDGKNVSVAGLSGKNPPVIEALKPSQPDGTNFRAVSASNTQNFKIANLKIIEKSTRFSTIMSSDAVDGTIKNIKMVGASGVADPRLSAAGPGWGLYQLQGGRNISASKLDGTGGVCFRLEQGTTEHVINGVNAWNITNRKGSKAILVGPKNPNNGTVAIGKVRTYESGWAVTSGDGKNGGKFTQVTIKDILASYGSKFAQFKTRTAGAADFIPTAALRNNIEHLPIDDGKKFATGPSSGVVRWDTAGTWMKFPNGNNKPPRSTGFPASYKGLGGSGKQPALVSTELFDALAAERK